MRSLITQFLKDNILLNPNQHCFRDCKDCLSPQHFDGFLKTLGETTNTDVICIDFSKAFDWVNHKVLLKELAKIGVRELTNRPQHVLVEGIRSSSFKVSSGVLQAFVLGPLRLIFYMIVIADVIKHSRLKILQMIPNSRKPKTAREVKYAFSQICLLLSSGQESNMLLNEDWCGPPDVHLDSENFPNQEMSTGNLERFHLQSLTP